MVLDSKFVVGTVASIKISQGPFWVVSSHCKYRAGRYVCVCVCAALLIFILYSNVNHYIDK
jgi:hypothetical protein